MEKIDRKQVFGIKELNRPENAEIDIVAVHGLNGDAFSTWTTDNGKICWLSDKDLLPKYVPNARVLTWGYNANVMSTKGSSTSADRILQHAQTLVAQLVADRELEGASQRPIIFLCHSLGGIVVKRALAYSMSRTAAKISHLHAIYTCTHSILFFGTPHAGSSKAHLLSSLQKLTALTMPRKLLESESGLTRALAEDSEVLQNITDQFAPLMSRFHIYFFWEQERTDLKYTRDYIVEETSAAPILDDTERSGIAADHRTMVKFHSKDSPGFRTVVAALRRYATDAPGVIKSRNVEANGLLRSQGWQKATELMRGIDNGNSRRPVAEGGEIFAGEGRYQRDVLEAGSGVLEEVMGISDG